MDKDAPGTKESPLPLVIVSQGHFQPPKYHYLIIIRSVRAPESNILLLIGIKVFNFLNENRMQNSGLDFIPPRNYLPWFFVTFSLTMCLRLWFNFFSLQFPFLFLCNKLISLNILWSFSTFFLTHCFDFNDHCTRFASGITRKSLLGGYLHIFPAVRNLQTELTSRQLWHQLLSLVSHTSKLTHTIETRSLLK